MGRGPRSKRGEENRHWHSRAYQTRRFEWFLVRETSYHDSERRETIAMVDSPVLNVERAEVLHDSHGFVAPALDPDASWRATLLRIHNLGR